MSSRILPFAMAIAVFAAMVQLGLSQGANAQNIEPHEDDEEERLGGASQDLGRNPGQVEVVVESEVVEIKSKRRPSESSALEFSKADLQRIPQAATSDVLRHVPGLVISQHAGGGKADQIFVRGFDADHGTDVAIFVDGVPVNMTSHGHGQGYADSHWVIPEMLSSLHVHKGPYAARYGDFYTGAAIEMQTVKEVEHARVALSAGSELSGPAAFKDPISRLVMMASPKIGTGKSVVAAEFSYRDGPFEEPQNFRKSSVMSKWSGEVGSGTLTLAANAYAARWYQSGQIPLRAVNAGELDRFGAVDPTEGGLTSRRSLAATWSATDDYNGRFTMSAYAIDYDFRLFSNFTLYARNPVRGDQIEQSDSRRVLGLSGSYALPHLVLGAEGKFEAGVQVRSDDISADLWNTDRRVRTDSCFESPNPCNSVVSKVQQISTYAEEVIRPLPWLGLKAGIRLDTFIWDVTNQVQGDPQRDLRINGSAQRAIVSPKVSAMIRAADGLDLNADFGTGFHSNDARAAVVGGSSDALARAIGSEVGARYRPHTSLETTLTFWGLYLSSEQVWSGDNGGTEASNETWRRGVDATVDWAPRPWLTFDFYLSLAKTSTDDDFGNSTPLPLAPKVSGGGGLSLTSETSRIGIRGRGVGDRPATSDESISAEGFLIFDAFASKDFGRWTVGLMVQNLLNSEWREAQFAEESRLQTEATAVEDLHFTPGVPLLALGTLALKL